MKIIKFDLAKKLNDLWLLYNIETEYVYDDKWTIYFAEDIKFVDTRKECNKIHNCDPYYIFCNAQSYAIQNQKNEWIIYKTLTTEEAIEFLPDNIVWVYWSLFNLVIDKWRDWYLINYKNSKHWTWHIKWWKYFKNNSIRLPLIEAIEKMIEYLINNNLLWHIKKNLL